MVRIELGCGKTKEDGFLGVDRFEMPGVDVVADLNASFPFDDNSVDEVWASHSLEHLDDIAHVFSEIYRICKHGAIVRILAPYYFTTLNMSNYYHKSKWTEDTPRLLDIYDTQMVAPIEWQMPHAISWGIGRSDNSDYKEIFQIIKEEFFYFPEYCHLSDELKCQARRSMINVCDQVYYILTVNKSGVPFSREELNEKLKVAQCDEPKRIDLIRERDRQNATKQLFSIYDKVNTIEKAVECEKHNYLELNRRLVKQNRDLDEKIELWEKTRDDLLNSYGNEINNQFYTRLAILNNNENYESIIKLHNRQFYDGMLLNDDYKRIEKVYFSRNLCLDNYLEFIVPSGFSQLEVCLFSLSQTQVFLELVQDGEIAKQVVEDVNGLQFIGINCNSISKKAFLRIRLNEIKMDSLVRILLVQDKNKEKLAYVATF